MTRQLFAERGNLFGRDRAGTVAPLAPLVRENVSNFLVGQGFVPWLHDRGAEFLAFDRDWTLQTLHDNHRRPTRTAGCKFRARERRILTCHAQTVGLMAGLTIGGKNLFAAIARGEFRDLLCALRSASFFHRLWLAAVRVERVAAEVSRVTTEIGTAKKDRQPVNCDQPNRERLCADARFALFALNGGVH